MWRRCDVVPRREARSSCSVRRPGPGDQPCCGRPIVTTRPPAGGCANAMVVPGWARRICAARVRPRPRCPGLSVRNGWNIWPRTSSGTPGPRSVMTMSTRGSPGTCPTGPAQAAPVSAPRTPRARCGSPRRRLLRAAPGRRRRSRSAKPPHRFRRPRPRLLARQLDRRPHGLGWRERAGRERQRPDQGTECLDGAQHPLGAGGDVLERRLVGVVQAAAIDEMGVSVDGRQAVRELVREAAGQPRDVVGRRAPEPRRLGTGDPHRLSTATAPPRPARGVQRTTATSTRTGAASVPASSTNGGRASPACTRASASARAGQADSEPPRHARCRGRRWTATRARPPSSVG